jgi:DNA-binding HxlR family transcriptional regulator
VLATLSLRIPKRKRWCEHERWCERDRKRGGNRRVRVLMPAPKPGTPARGSDTGRPIMALLDLLGRRWALRTIWELRDGPCLFRELQERCDGMSSSVLNQRLSELRGAGVVDLGPRGYELTDEGRTLLDAYAPLNAWAERWAARTARP